MSARLRNFERELLLAAFSSLPSARLDRWVLDRLASITEERFVHAGEVLWSADAPVGALYFMREGRVRMSRASAPPWTFEGQWFLGMFEGRRGEVARREAVALTDFAALSLPPRAWFALLEDSFELMRGFAAAAAASVASLDERIPSGVVALPPWRPSPGRGERSLGVLGRLAVLTELQMARGAGVQALADLAAASKELTVEEGEHLFRGGASRDHFHVVASGTIEARRALPEAARRYRAGEIVTGAAAFAERAQEWEARALSRAQVIAVPLEAWFDLMEDHFDLAQSFLGVLGTWRERALDGLAEAAGAAGIILTS